MPFIIKAILLSISIMTVYFVFTLQMKKPGLGVLMWLSEWAKDPALSLQWLMLLWHGFNPWPQEHPHAMSAAK